jgi:RING-box protein 1
MSAMNVSIIKYDAVAQIVMSGATNCSICLNKLDEPSLDYHLQPRKAHPGLSVVAGQCGHRFHLDCCTTWMERHSTCPVCANQWVQIKIAQIDYKAKADVAKA